MPLCDMAQQSAMSETAMGTRNLVRSQGGFLKPHGGCPDICIRRSAKRGAVTILAAGERVRYELVTSGKPAKTEAVVIAKAI
jgi:cold shock CspA family protein